MGIFDSFTGAPVKKAAKKSTGLWNTVLSDLSQYNNWAGDNAANEINTSSLDALRALQGYGGQARSSLGTGINMARGDVRSNSDQALRYLTGAMDLYQPYREQGGAASVMLSNALGLNGEAGGAVAQAAFEKASPELAIANDRAAEAISRKMSSLGMGGSGNTLASIADRVSDNVRTHYGSWVDRLTGQQGLAMRANDAVSGLAGQQAGIASNTGNTLGSLAYGWGRDDAGVSTGLGSSIGGMNERRGQRLAGLWDTRAGRMNDLRLKHAQAVSDNWAQSANAQQQGNANAWGAGLGLLNTGLKAFGGGMF